MGRKAYKAYQPTYSKLTLTEVELCYFAALVDGLRLISQHGKDRLDLTEDFDADALVRYVSEKGSQIYTATRITAIDPRNTRNNLKF